MFLHPFSSTLYEHYEAINARLFGERDAALAALKNSADAAAHVQKVRAKLQKIFNLPKRPAPECRIVGQFEANKVVVDKLLFRVAEERWCSGWFLRLPGAERRPAALVVCGHSDDGKFCDAYQMVAFSLARKGFGVMFFDPIGQGEMYQHRDTPGFSPVIEHNYIGRLCTLEGTQLCTMFVNDASCAIDNLLARPEVLPGPVCVTGNSGGGQMTYYLHGLDDRVGFAAPSCHMNTLRAIFRDEIATDSESSPGGLVAAGCDRPDFGIAGAPKPLLLIGQDNDFVDLRGLKKACADIKHIYDLLGKSEDLELFIGSGEHGFVKHGREAAYGFFTERIMGKRDAAEPEDVAPVLDEKRQVAPTGRVIDMENMRSIPELFQAKWAKRKFTASAEEISSFLKKSLQIEKFQAEAPDYRILRAQGFMAERVGNRWAWNTDNTPAVAVLCLLAPDTRVLVPEGKECTLVVSELSAARDLCARAGKTERIFALDVRGIGMSEAETGNQWGDYGAPFNREYFLDNTGRLMDESLAGGRVRDILAALALLRSCGYEKITLEGSGHAALMVAYACGAMGKIPGVESIVLHNAPATFTKEDFALRAPVFLSGMLQHFDLPQLYELLGKNYSFVNR